MTGLHAEIHYAVNLASDSGLIGNLCAALADLGFGPLVQVLEYEKDRDAAEVELADPLEVFSVVIAKGSRRGPLYDSLVAESPPERSPRFGEVILRGSHARTWMKIRFGEDVPAMAIGDQWVFSNSISVSTERSRLGSVRVDDWLRDLIMYLADDPRVLWGGAWDRDEFAASNLHDDSDGMWALGRDVRRALPGLYWLNVIGPPYLDLIGRRRVLSTPGRVTEVGSSVVIEVYPAARDWRDDDGWRAKEASLSHLGLEYFFDRSAPGRATLAPDFGLHELRPSQRLQAFASDGETVTPLPRLDIAPTTLRALLSKRLDARRRHLRQRGKGRL